jgi:hypothetical protein
MSHDHPLIEQIKLQPHQQVWLDGLRTKTWVTAEDQFYKSLTQQSEDMKRKLSGDQFTRRFPVLDGDELAYRLERYTYELDQMEHPRSSVLLDEIVLRHEEIRRPSLPPDKCHDLVATFIIGYRICRVARSCPDRAEILAVYSPLTRCWHP